MRFEANNRQCGLSVVEVLLAVALIGILAYLGVSVTNGVRDTTARTKLQSEVQVLNSATMAFIASNGVLDEKMSVDEVMTKLKSVASDASAKTIAGLRGNFLDSRVKLVFQNEEEAATAAPRIYWEPAKLRFRYAEQGPPGGIAQLRLEETDTPPLIEERSGVLKLASEDTWIWDYVEAPTTNAAGPSVIPTTQIPSTPPAAFVVAPPPTPPPPPPPPPRIPLDPPTFSLPGGSYPTSVYDLAISIGNPNPPGSSELFFSIDYQPWVLYSSSLSIPVGTVLRAQATPIEDGYTASSITSGSYTSGISPLSPPNILSDYPSFSVFTSANVLITLEQTNEPGASRMRYRVDGGPWVDYVGPFALLRSNHPSGASIEAQALATNLETHIDSGLSYRYLPSDSLDFRGGTSGNFYDPIGPSEMVTNLTGNTTDSYFEWGKAAGENRSESWLDFQGAAFDNIINGEQFNIGSLSYYNGTINSGTGADSIFLDITLSLDFNGTVFNPYFDFQFDLINTPNTEDEWESADYVFLDDATASRTLVINGYEFEFELAFGEATENGFAVFDEFHVIENRDASVNLYGAFNLIRSPKPDEEVGSVVIWDGISDASELTIYQNIGYRDPEELVKDLEDESKINLGTAEDAAKWAEEQFDFAEKALADFIKNLESDNFGKAEEFLELARLHLGNLRSFTRDVIGAEEKLVAAAARAGHALDLDPELIKDVTKIREMSEEGTVLRTETVALRGAMSEAFARAEQRWNNAREEALSGKSEKYARYLLQLAEQEVEIAAAAPDRVADAYKVVAKIDEGFSDLILRLDYSKVETEIGKIETEMAESLASIEAARAAAERAHGHAAEASTIAAIQPKAQGSAEKAHEAAAEADAFVIEAEAAYADLAALAGGALDELTEFMEAGPDKHPLEYADYLLDKVKDAYDAVKDRFDVVKDAHGETKSATKDAKNFIDDRELDEAALALENAQHFAALAAEVEPAVGWEAPKVRPFTLPLAELAARKPVAAAAYEKALDLADKAEEMPGDARALVEEAQMLAVEAEEYIRNSIR